WMLEGAISERARLRTRPSRVGADPHGSAICRQILDLDVESRWAVERALWRRFIAARPRTAKDRRTRQRRECPQLRRGQDGVDQLEEGIARVCQTTITGLAEGRQLAKLRLGGVFMVHTSIALPGSGFGKPITAVFIDQKRSD